jgi:hypothetical protein
MGVSAYGRVGVWAYGRMGVWAYGRNANTQGSAIRWDLCDSWDQWVSHISPMCLIGAIRWQSPTYSR